MGKQLGHNKFVENALKYGFSLWGLPKTGQTTSYRTGDDGDLKKGYPKEPPRFKDNGDGTITDNATGLMWVKDPSQLGGVWGTPGNPSDMTWNNAIDNCLALDYAGHNDWRLPNVVELMSIRRWLHSGPTWDPIYFPNSQLDYYWTATQCLEQAGYKWGVRGNDGYPGGRIYTAEDFVRPVRLGVPK